jgi:hypothetical protein
MVKPSIFEIQNKVVNGTDSEIFEIIYESDFYFTDIKLMSKFKFKSVLTEYRYKIDIQCILIL